MILPLPGELLSTFDIPFPTPLDDSIVGFKLVLNETALVMYLNDSVSMMTLNDDLATAKFTEIMPLKFTLNPWLYRHYFPTFAVDDRFYSISREKIEWRDLE